MKSAISRRYFRHGTLTQLWVFQAIARHGSFTRAAEELHLAQPTVSIQMKKLAETAGTPLFAPAGRGVVLTQAGREMLATVDELFASFVGLESRLAALRPDAMPRQPVTQPGEPAVHSAA